MSLLCKLIGHKFLKSKGGYTYRATNCWRCGAPHAGPGGKGGPE